MAARGRIRLERGATGHLDERWLAEVWERQAFDRQRLRTTNGLGLKVVFPGLRTGEAGPDFHDAILALPDGALLRGDVELHLEAAGWEQHRHHQDPAYDHVLLHVVLDGGPQAYTSQGVPVLTLELAGRMKPGRHGLDGGAGTGTLPAAGRAVGGPSGTAPFSDGEPGWPTTRAEERPYRIELDPEAGRVPGGAPGLRSMSEATARYRVHNGQSGGAFRAVEGRAAAPTASEAQLTYVVAPCRHLLPRKAPAALAEAFHRLAVERFQSKQAVFEGELAVFEPEQALYAGLLEALGYSRNRAQFRELALSVPLASLRLLGSAAAMREALLAAAGLGGDGGRLIEAGIVPAQPPTWHMLGVRPDNWPARRIEQVSAILARLSAALLDELLGPLADVDGGSDVAALRREWQAMLAEVGQQRADAIAINVLLPFGAAYGQASCQFLLAEQATAAFLAFPAEGGNQVTRYMRRDILGALPPPSGAAGEQALLHVWDQWCHQKVCNLCPLGSRARS